MQTAPLKTDVSQDSILNYTPKPVFKVLEQTVKRFGTRPALTFGAYNATYEEMAQQIDQVAAGLQSLGVQKGTKVGIYMPNTQYSVLFYYGILKAGGTVVNYNPLYAIRELTFQVENSETEILVTITNDDMLSKASALLEGTDLSKVVVCPLSDTDKIPEGDAFLSYNDVVSTGTTPRPVEVDVENDTAVLQYTGGTTGVPKAAVLTHANVNWNAEQFFHLLSDVAVEGEEKTLGILPLFHVFAMTVVMNYSIRIGAEMILMPRFDPKLLGPVLTNQKPTIIPAVPAAFAAIAKHPATCNIDLSYTKYCVAGGAPIAREVKELFERNTGAKCIEAYGLTEASPVTNSNPPVGVTKVGSIGPVIPGTEVRIVSTEDRSTVMAQGDAGEVCFRGPQVMKEYFKNEEETANTLRDGWLHTGDIGYLDEDGYVFLLDRLKDMILINGYNVYPTQVEGQIYTHPAVDECLVAGVKDATRGEVAWCWVTVKEGESLTEGDLKTFLKDKLSSVEIPRKVIIRDEPLPKTSVGKLSRKMLLEEEGLV